MRALALMLALCAGCMTPRAALPLWGGTFTNVQCSEPGRTEDSCDRARTNAIAHVAWGFGVPALGHVIGGRKGMRIAGALWIAETLIGEAFFHAPPGPLDAAYSSEVRTDLISRILPTLILLGVDWLLEAP